MPPGACNIDVLPVFDDLGQAILVVRKKIIISANQVAGELFGRPVEDLVGQNIDTCIDPEAVSHFRDRYKVLFDLPETFPLNTANGSAKAEVSITPTKLRGFLWDKPAEVIRFDKIFNEVEEGHPLYKYIQIFAEIFSSSDKYGVTFSDPNGVIVWINDAEIKIHGYSNKDELIGQSSSIFGLPQMLTKDSGGYSDKDELFGQSSSIFGLPQMPTKDSDGRRRSPITREFSLRREFWRQTKNVKADGTLIDVNLVSNKIFDAEERLIGIVTICEDVSKRVEREQHLATYPEVNDDSLVEVKAGQVTYLNPAAERSFPDLQMNSEAPDDIKSLIKSLEVGRKIYTKDEIEVGNRIYERTAQYVSKNGDNFVVIWIHDITELKGIQKKLSILAKIPAQNPNPVIRTDFDGRNPNPLNKHVRKYFPVLEPGIGILAGIDEAVKKLLVEGQESLTSEIVIPDPKDPSKKLTFERDIYVDTENLLVTLYIHDITPLKEIQEQLRIQAVRDPLTGLFNRRHMKETLEREVSRAHRLGIPLSAIMFDVDHFKFINDECGHPAGDYALEQLAELLSKHVRREDIFCRYGGEEFAVILPGMRLEIAKNLAEEMRCTMECQRMSFDVETGLEKVTIQLPPITISLGIATLSDGVFDGSQLLHVADMALLRAKRTGRNRAITYDPELDYEPGSEKVD